MSHFLISFRSVFVFICLIIISKDSFAQCDNNILSNGSFNSIVGEDVTASGWYATWYTNNSPDVNDSNGPLNTTSGYTWDGTPIASSDGGTWQNLFGPEQVYQLVTLTPGTNYILEFEYASTPITSSTISFTDPVGVEVKVNNNIFITPNDSTHFTWETASFTFTADSTSATLSMNATTQNYVAIDGVCLIEIENEHVEIVDNFLGKDTILCLGDTLVLNASHNDASYLWQDGSTDSTYTVTQTGNYSVELSINGQLFKDSLSISFVNCDTLDLPEEIPNDVKLYPNPISDQINVDLDKEYENLSVRIINQFGQLVFEKKYWQTSQLQISLDIPAGMYILEIRDKFIQPKRFKFIRKEL